MANVFVDRRVCCFLALVFSSLVPIAPCQMKSSLPSSGEPHDLNCRVSELSPEMGLDLRFHTGYVATIPLKELSGAGRRLSVTSRIIPLREKANAIVLVDRASVPAIDREARGDAEFPGQFVVGPGEYQVDWIIRSEDGRACSAHWQIEAKLGGDFQNVPLAIGPDTVEAPPVDPYREATSIIRDRKHPLYVKILVNFSTGDGSGVVLSDADEHAIVSILRAVMREPSFGLFSVVAFSTDEQRVLHRQAPARRIDFMEMRNAVKALHPGTVYLQQLTDRDSDRNFLENLLIAEFSPQNPTPDALIVISPKVKLERGIAKSRLVSAEHAQCPVFYLSYDADPQRNVWRGALESGLRAYHALVYSITRPRDLGSALSDMASKLSFRN